MANLWPKELIEPVSDGWEWHGLALHIGFQYREPQDVDDCCEGGACGEKAFVAGAIDPVLVGNFAQFFGFPDIAHESTFYA